jgi:hypothetical protein
LPQDSISFLSIVVQSLRKAGFSMRTPLIAVLATLPLFASIAGAKAVPLTASNQTSVAVSLHMTGYVDANGDRQQADWTWKLDPNAGEAQLTVDDHLITASEADVTLTTSDGDASWIYRAEDASEHLAMQITYAELKRGEGAVSLANDTSDPVRCTLIDFVDAHGKKTLLKPESFEVPAKTTIPMIFHDAPMSASTLRFYLETAEGAHAWISSYGGGADLAIHFTDALLADHRKVVSEAKGTAIVKMIGAMAADSVANAALEKKDLDLGDLLVAGLGKYTRSQLIDSAIEDVFPAFADEEKQQAARVIGLVFDGELNADNLREAEARDVFVKRLSESNVNAGRAAELLNFASDLASQHSRRASGN